jgi:homoserine dehydrogenase
MSPIRVGLLGIGTVGGGTWDVLKRNASEIRRRAGRAIRISRVADKDLRKARKLAGGKARVTGDAWDVVRAPDIDIVVELIGGTGIAKDLVLEAIARGKHVVTANKALLAKHGNRDLRGGAEEGRDGRVRGAVAAAFRSSRRCARAWPPTASSGSPASSTAPPTSSSRNARQGAVLRRRRSPRRRRAATPRPIPPSTSRAWTPRTSSPSSRRIAFGIPMQFAKAYTEGISKLTPADIGYAEELGYRIKLLGITRRAGRHRAARASHARARAAPDRQRRRRDERGAGEGRRRRRRPCTTVRARAAEPTASAVVADLVDVTRLHTADPGHRVPHLAFQPDQLATRRSCRSARSRLRTTCACACYGPARRARRITRILADSASPSTPWCRRSPPKASKRVDIVMLTHRAVEKNVDAALAQDRGACPPSSAR